MHRGMMEDIEVMRMVMEVIGVGGEELRFKGG